MDFRVVTYLLNEQRSISGLTHIFPKAVFWARRLAVLES